jgi:hypothetical protein
MAWIGQPGQESGQGLWYRTASTKKTGQDGQNVRAGTGQGDGRACYRTARENGRAGQPGQLKEKTGRTENSMDREATTGQLGQESWRRTARTGHPEQDRQDSSVWTGQGGHIG